MKRVPNLPSPFHRRHRKFLAAAAAVAAVAALLPAATAVAGPTRTQTKPSAPAGLVSPTTPADVPYALPVKLPATKSSPSVAADAPYTPTVLSLISQLEPDNPPTEAELANASILFHGGTNGTCNNVGPTAAPTGTTPSIMAPCWTDAQGVNTFSGPERGDDHRPDHPDEPRVFLRPRRWPMSGARRRAPRAAS